MSTFSGHLRPMRRIKRVHFVGIGGTGMNGIAEVLVNQGFNVSGSDLKESRVTGRLKTLGVRVFIGHDARHIDGVDVLVVSTAVPDSNPEVVAARELRIPVVPRAQMLAELMRFKRGIAVAGTHGKTTTTSLTASLLAEAGLDPTFVIGGVVNSWGSNARLGQGEYLLAEADESDGSFLLLQPIIALVTNIDRDHLESYKNSFENLKKAFVEFLHHLPFYGAAILCIDDPELKALIPQMSRAVVTFGLSESADIRATDIRQNGRNMSFNVHLPHPSKPVEVSINLPGLHNVRNALGAIAVAWEIGIEIDTVVDCLREFKGVGRRFAEIGELLFGSGRVRAIEDYGHHPSELEATIAAARTGWPENRIVAVFQPHRYTRTANLFDEFSRVLSEADIVVLTDIYSAGEAAIEGVDSAALCKSIRARGKVDPILVHDVEELSTSLPPLLQDGDLVLLMGAGSIEQVAHELRDTGFKWGGGVTLIPAMKTNDPGRFGNVGLLVGGESAEREVSLNGGSAVFAALQRNNIKSEMFDGSAALFEAISAGRIDRVFNLMHGPGGEDGAIQGALQLMHVPVTGTNLLGSAVSMDKVRSKWIWERQGINTPPFFLLKDDGKLAGEFIEEWGLPLFVKPAGLGSSIGISKVENIDELPAAITLAREYDDHVIVEPAINGNEYFAGIIGDLVFALIHIETPRSFYDYTAKYESDDTGYFCPCGLSQDIEKTMQDLSLEAFKALECSGWGRVDFIIDEAGKAWFLEANTTPGMTNHSLVPQAAAQLGIGFDELVWRILESSL